MLSASRADLTEGPSIWSSILTGVVSTRGVISKNVLVLGSPQSGKTTVIEAIRQRHPHKIVPSSEPHHQELALSYSYMDVEDDENEDVIARVGLYHLASSTAFGNLFRFALSPASLSDSMVIITLDWAEPWTFLKTLQDWLQMLGDYVEKREKEDPEAVQTMKDRLELFFRSYTEPVERSNFNNDTFSSGPQHPMLLPLTQGTLTRNLGIPIVIVVHKADLTTLLERDRDFKEEQFDFIQQTLRTICLTHGAALFYTSTHRPETLADVRNYVLHRLFDTPPPAHAPLGSSFSLSHISHLNHQGSVDSMTQTTTNSLSFPFTERPRIIDRDTVFIPTGWDSWGKIKILREAFDCASMSGEVRGDGEDDEISAGLFGGAKEIFEGVITNPYKDEVLTTGPTLTAEPENVFLERLNEILESSTPSPGTTSPRNASPRVISPSRVQHTPSTVNPGVSSDAAAAAAAAVLKARLTAAVPQTANSAALEEVTAKVAKLTKTKEMASSTLASFSSLTSESFSSTSSLPHQPTRRLTNTPSDVPLPTSSHSSSATQAAVSRAAASSSAAASVAAAAGTVSGGGAIPAASQNEVLANFFQSLLAKKGSTLSSTGGSCQ
ncbi:dynein light intermediate chain-domain-containing protein [Phlyctochytrium arcticum]|nr:dynein light intermediate chain-domain-containing protein [Phlyctochytrium arcticum]